MLHPSKAGGWALLGLALVAGPSLGAGPSILTARLSPVPLTVGMQSTVAGLGHAQAVIAGNHVEVTGAYDGLRSAATRAQVHTAIKGLRGPVILDLTVVRDGDGTKGAIKGAFDLTPGQRDDLVHEHWYIQLDSEKAPDGNLWGWLLPQAVRP